ncbi:lymphocyte cytosolic protein 2 isoform X2 [Sceloporus undulatus]|uniref:lymphocyte cytosolic protein 2 isoform X2 n=1 Tax=Sceloporus undulatus TaxID=8520 RepID=UPI001C4B82A6|nr:lymphocyte cytosolic protein 2 isoform X2 [Sceloporus undulatus]
MDSRNTPYRSEVARWSPDDLADYFRRLNFKDCEKVAKKHNITGQRFLNMSENDIQKFPKLRMPILSKLSQEINRHEERKGFFQKRTQTQKIPENTEYRQEEGDGWSSFDESDDYVSPDEDDPEGGVDYETPNDQDGVDDGNDADYEPPPSNNDDTLRNVIFPSKPIPATSEYIDRPTTDRSKTSLQPPLPPQRPVSSPVPAMCRGRGTVPPFLSPLNNNESNREKSIRSFKPPAPSVDRSKKPPLDRSGPPFERDILGAGKTYPEMSLTPQLRSLGQELAKIQKPPVPSTDRHERNIPPSRRKPPPIMSNHTTERKTEIEDGNVPQRPVPQPSLQPFNTFPSRSKPQSKHSPLPPRGMPDAYTESTASTTVSLPPRLQSSSIPATYSKGPDDGRPPLPVPNRPTTQFSKAENEEVERFNKKWYAADITRPEAEIALRTINQDGTYLVRDSSRKTPEQPYVLMVLYNNKVYNIQIRYQQEYKLYFLGTGMKANEEFTSVADIIDNFTRMPLLLIDGKDRCSRKQCVLKYAAGCL